MGTINIQWLERALDQKGITKYALKFHHKFSPDNFDRWLAGMRPRPSTLRKLAQILEMEYAALVAGLRIVQSTAAARRRAISN